MKMQDRIREAYRRGYRVRSDGEVVSPTGLVRKVHSNSKGKLKFNIRVNGKALSLCVHRLGAYQKFGELIFKDGLEVRHLDDDGINNSLTNLGIGTHSQNEMDRPPETRLARARHAASFQRKLTEEEAKQLRKDRSSGMTYKQLCLKYSISKSAVSYIVHRRTYSEG